MKDLIFLAGLFASLLDHFGNPVSCAVCLAHSFFFVTALMDLLSTGADQSQADQPNNLAEGHPM